MSPGFSLLAHSCRRIRNLILSAGALMAGFQLLFCLAARAAQELNAYGSLSALVPDFLRQLMGPSLFGAYHCHHDGGVRRNRDRFYRSDSFAPIGQALVDHPEHCAARRMFRCSALRHGAGFRIRALFLGPAGNRLVRLETDSIAGF